MISNQGSCGGGSDWNPNFGGYVNPGMGRGFGGGFGGGYNGGYGTGYRGNMW